MTPGELVRKYPRLALVILAVHDDSDVSWAGQILQERTDMSRAIIKEAIRKRHSYKLGPAAYRGVESLIRSLEPTPTMCQV